MFGPHTFDVLSQGFRPGVKVKVRTGSGVGMMVVMAVVGVKGLVNESH